MTGKVFLSDDMNKNYLCGYIVSCSADVLQDDIERQLRASERKALITPLEKPVENHWLVDAHIWCGGSSTFEEIIGVTHSETKILEKTYRCALDYAQGIAKRCSWDFADLTSRANQDRRID